MNALALILLLGAAPQTPVTVEEYIQLKDISDENERLRSYIQKMDDDRVSD